GRSPALRPPRHDAAPRSPRPERRDEPYADRQRRATPCGHRCRSMSANFDKPRLEMFTAQRLSQSRLRARFPGSRGAEVVALVSLVYRAAARPATSLVVRRALDSLCRFGLEYFC